MRTLLFILSGVIISLVCRLLGRPFSAYFPSERLTLAMLFTGLWLLVSLANMLVGIYRAGYGITEELAIALLIFLPPMFILFWPSSR